LADNLAHAYATSGVRVTNEAPAQYLDETSKDLDALIVLQNDF